METMDLGVFISFDDAGNANTAEWFAEATVEEGVMEVVKSNGIGGKSFLLSGKAREH